MTLERRETQEVSPMLVQGAQSGPWHRRAEPTELQLQRAREAQLTVGGDGAPDHAGQGTREEQAVRG